MQQLLGETQLPCLPDIHVEVDHIFLLSDSVFLGSDTVQSSHWLPMFWRDMSRTSRITSIFIITHSDSMFYAFKIILCS